MLHQEIAHRLLDLELFRGLERTSIERVAREADRVIFRPGQAIVRAGEPGDAAYLLLSGDAATVPVDGVGAFTVAPGSLIGEVAMLVDHHYAVSVVCQGQVRAVRLGREMLRAAMLAEPKIAEHFVARLSARLARVAVELRRIDDLLAVAGAAEPREAAVG